MMTLALLLSQSPFTQAVTLPATVDDLPSVVAKLEPTAGVKLVVSPSMQNEIVGLAIPNRPLQEALDALAAATDAKWTENNGTLTLARTIELDQRRRDRDRRNRIENLTKMLAPVLQNIDPQPLTPERALTTFKQHFTRRSYDSGSGVQEIWVESKGNFYVRRPMYQLTRRMIQNVGAAGFADLPQGTTVFSTNPTQLQRAFPNAPHEMAKRYADEGAIWANLASQMREDEPFVRSLPPYKRVSKMLFVVRREGRNFNMIAAVYDENGILYEQQPESLQSFYQQFPGAYKLNDLPKFELAPQAAAIAKGQGVPASDRKLWLSPNVHEPLAAVAASPIEALARHRKHVVAVHLSDQLLEPLLGIGRLQTHLAAWLNKAPRYGMTEVPGQNATIIQQRTPVDELSLRFDRTAMAKFFASRGPRGEYRLQNFIDYAGAEPNLSTSMAMRYFTMSQLVPSGRNLRRPQWLVALASLSVAQRKGILDQNRFLLRKDLTARQQQLFAELRQSRVYVERELSKEPTENLLSGDFQVSSHLASEPGWFRTTDLAPITINQLAQFRHWGRQPGQSQQNAPTPELFEGQNRVYSVNVVFGTMSNAVEALEDHIVGTSKVSSANLPPDVEKKIMAIRKQLPAVQRRGGPTYKLPPP